MNKLNEITKSRFDELIEDKANKRVKQILMNITSNFPWDINGNGAPAIEFNDKCGELAGKPLYSQYSENALLNSNGNEKYLNEYTNWPEIKEKLLKKYEKGETDKVLQKLSEISDFLDRQGDF
ncbi:hypothetical protein EFS28_09455 [Lactobacillus acidophilus]|uniref:hypothetical protein n=1 Tax=Lactobacillus acidophilus TaxID=1579 RepID=UPI0021A8993F|nr:hypothetical protein [Lactobacillus acidophilus]MCT3602110.1 hypothetical protein [Lactobacillus acidophilus]MCT3624423.1 hypothetical protein [Lactobacillus acidophilus]